MAGWTKILSWALTLLNVQTAGPIAPHATLEAPAEVPSTREVWKSAESHCPDSHYGSVCCAAERKSHHTWKGNYWLEFTWVLIEKESVHISTVAVPTKIHLATEIKMQKEDRIRIKTYYIET